MKQFLRKVVIESDSKIGRRFDIFIQILILLSLVSFSIETLPNLDENFRDLLNQIELKVNWEKNPDEPRFSRLTESETRLQDKATEKEIYNIFEGEIRKDVDIKSL